MKLFDEIARQKQQKTDHKQKQLLLLRKKDIIGAWSFDVLRKRLTEKLNEAVFVAADSRGSGRTEEFHFQTVTYCSGPSVERFLKLVESNDVIVELRMHVKESGSARNHGTAFRLKKHRLIDLFQIQCRCRPPDTE